MARSGNIPPEAQSNGGVNESTPADQRSPDPRSDLGEGPKIGERGEHLPARYPVRSGIREDR